MRLLLSSALQEQDRGWRGRARLRGSTQSHLQVEDAIWNPEIEHLFSPNG